MIFKTWKNLKRTRKVLVRLSECKDLNKDILVNLISYKNQQHKKKGFMNNLKKVLSRSQLQANNNIY